MGRLTKGIISTMEGRRRKDILGKNSQKRLGFRVLCSKKRGGPWVGAMDKGKGFRGEKKGESGGSPGEGGLGGLVNVGSRGGFDGSAKKKTSSVMALQGWGTSGTVGLEVEEPGGGGDIGRPIAL